MSIEGFIFSWNAHEAEAAELERRIGRLIDVTVINSEERLAGPHNAWVQLDDSAYFSAQWNTARRLFKGDVLFHMQADARCDDLERLFQQASAMFRRGDVGVYEPCVDFSTYRYDTSQLRGLGNNVFEIPIPDQTCWFVAADVLRRLPPVDVSVNRYGWGISAAVAAVCRLERKLCLRDYGVSVLHPRSRGYASALAADERDAYLASLGPEIASEAARLYEWRSRVGPARPKRGGIGCRWVSFRRRRRTAG